MAINKKLDEYWSEFLNNFICTLLADGYDEFEVLDKIMEVFKTVRTKRFIEEHNNKVAVEKGFVTTSLINKLNTSVNEPISSVKKVRKYPEHHKNPDRRNNPHNYDKTLSSKFPHAYIYVIGKKDESLATIEYGPSQKVRDIYKLVSTGEELNEVQYLRKFNTDGEETPKGYGYLNRHVIVFEANPDVSVGLVKHKNNYKKFSNMNDVITFKKYANRK